jgi:hypothetical protein
MQILTFNYEGSMAVAGDSTCFLQLDVSTCFLALGTKPSQLNQCNIIMAFLKLFLLYNLVQPIPNG